MAWHRTWKRRRIYHVTVTEWLVGPHSTGAAARLARFRRRVLRLTENGRRSRDDGRSAEYLKISGVVNHPRTNREGELEARSHSVQDQDGSVVPCLHLPWSSPLISILELSLVFARVCLGIWGRWRRQWHDEGMAEAREAGCCIRSRSRTTARNNTA